jgi:cell cycle checkpoint protein
MSDIQAVGPKPIFTAVSSSAPQLFLLLRCIGFGSKVQVHISEEGLRFSLEDSSVMEGDVFRFRAPETRLTLNTT